MSLNFISGSNVTAEHYDIDKGTARGWSIMLSHLDCVKDFYHNTTSDFAIICEDDIFVRKKLKSYLPAVLKDFRELDLDVLLLSYLTPYHPRNHCSLIETRTHAGTDAALSYFTYPDDMWGDHMYMISRAYAAYTIEKFTIEWAVAHKDKHYSPDWILTKNGTRALVWPPLGVEEGVANTDHQGHVVFHRQCREFLYDESLYE